jgi:hypothetical protein
MSHSPAARLAVPLRQRGGLSRLQAAVSPSRLPAGGSAQAGQVGGEAEPYPAAATRPRRIGAKADLALLSAGLYCLVAVSHIQVLLPFLKPLRLGITAIALSVGLMLLDGSRARRIEWLGDRTSLGTFLLLGWMIATIPVALASGVAYKAVTENFIKVALFYSVMVLAVRFFKDIERLALVFAAGGAAYCLSVMFTSTMAGARVAQVNSSYDPNDFAAYVASCIPIAIYFVGTKRSWIVRLGALGGIAILMYGLVLSGSRGGMVALTFAMGFILFSFDATRMPTKIGIAAVGLVTVLSVANEEWYARMATLFNADDDYNVTAEVGRTQTWKRGLGYFASRPMTGVGAENFPVAEGLLNPLVQRERYGFGVQRNAAHNSYVQVLTELGIPGILLFLTMIYGAFRALGQGISLRVDRTERSLGQALRASLVAMLVAAFFLSHAYSAMLYACFALAIGYGKAAALDRPAAG